MYTDYDSNGDITQLPTFIVTFSRLHLIVRGRQKTRFCFDELPCRIDLLLRLLKQKRYKEKNIPFLVSLREHAYFNAPSNF